MELVESSKLLENHFQSFMDLLYFQEAMNDDIQNLTTCRAQTVSRTTENNYITNKI